MTSTADERLLIAAARGATHYLDHADERSSPIHHRRRALHDLDAVHVVQIECGQSGVERPARRDSVDHQQERIELVQPPRSEEHTSELQSRLHLVCRLLLEKKKI